MPGRLWIQNRHTISLAGSVTPTPTGDAASVLFGVPTFAGNDLVAPAGMGATASLGVATTNGAASWIPSYEPAGARWVRDFYHDDFTTDNTSGIRYGLNQPSVTALDWITNAPTGQASGGTGAMRMKYGTGFTGGQSAAKVVFVGSYDPAIDQFGAQNYREYFYCFDWMPSANWTKHPSGVDKLMFTWVGNGAGISRMTEWFTQSNGMPGNFMGVAITGSTQGVNNTDHFIPNCPSQNVVVVSAGNWYKVACHYRTSDGGGANNGRMRWWINDILQGDYTGLVDDAVNYISDVYYSPTWGGTGGTKSRDEFYYFGRTRVCLY